MKSTGIFIIIFFGVLSYTSGQPASRQKPYLSNPIIPSLNFSKDTTANNLCYEANIGTSINGHIVLIYRVDKGEGNLYTSCLNDNSWTKPEKLNKNIKTDGLEYNSFISADGGTLFFSSDRSGGYGGKDIYKSIKLPNGKWGKAANLGAAINTARDEIAPFFCPDGHTLYFSSNGYKKSTCFDILTSTLSDKGVWTKPANIGYPAKATDYDVLVSVINYDKLTTDMKNGYYRTIKEDVYDDKSNYIVTFYNDKKSSITLIKGKVMGITGKYINDSKITVTDNETEEILGVYNANIKSGNYLFILPSGKNISISYEAEGYLFQSEHFDISNDVNYYNLHKTVKMYPFVKDASTILNNIFFAPQKADILPVSNFELNKVFGLLNMNPDLIIEICYYIGSEGKRRYDKKLAFDRAQAVGNYLIMRGINMKRIISKGYRESKFAVQIRKLGEDQISNNELFNNRLELKILNINSKSSP